METIDCIQKAIDFIEDNIYSELNFEVIASQAYMSNYHFQRLFNLICDMPLGDYIHSRRLSLAGNEIVSSNTKIIDIAFKYGYESSESFSRAFTRFHGISPSAARSLNKVPKMVHKISIKSYLGGNEVMEKLKARGYSVTENAPIYYTENMDETAKWFEDVLGWYAGIDLRNENGLGLYGCVLPIPGEIKNMTLIPFNGFHMFYGKPSKKTVGFIRVDNINSLHGYIKKSGWTQISEIINQEWGGKECDVVTIDGGVIRFFQLD